MKREGPVGFYEITYTDNGFVQKKELISLNDHTWYKDLHNRKVEVLELIHKHRQDKKNKKKNIPVDPALTNELKEIEKTIKVEFPYDFFVVGSPMYDALTTGVIQIDEPAGNAGLYKMTAKQISQKEI